MVRMVRSLADRTFQLCPKPLAELRLEVEHLFDDLGLLLGRQSRELARQVQDSRFVHGRVGVFLARHASATIFEPEVRVGNNFLESK